MAKLGAEIGLPTVEPGRAPGVYQTAQATADTFGASQARERARAAQGIAQDMQQLSNTVIKAIDYYDETAADDAANQFQARVGTLLNGDPNVQGPDGTPDLGYLSTRGRLALDERERVEKRITEYEKELLTGLKNDRQRKKFSEFATKYRTTVTGKISNHADVQNVAWSENVNLATEKLALDQIAQDPTNAVSLAAAAADLRTARVRSAQLKGGGPELVNAAIASADRDFIKVQVEALAIDNPMQAMTVLQKNRQQAGIYYDDLYNRISLRVDQQVGASVAQEEIAKARTRIPVPSPDASPDAVPPVQVSPEIVGDAIIQQESGGRRDVGVSANGAMGPGQIMPATFAAYAKPGESIENPDDNERVSRRITADYYQKFNGDVARVAVAYFSGEGNVAPEGSPTPWKRNTADANGKTVADYVADVTRRIGGEAPVTGVRAQRADAMQAILDRTDLTPRAKQTALAQIKTFYEVQTAQANEARRKAHEQRSAFTSTFEIQLKRGQKTYADIENAWQNGYLSDAKRTDLTLWLDEQGKKQDKITQAIGSVEAALNGGRLMDPKTPADREAVDMHYDITSQAWRNLPPAEILPRAIQYAGEVGMAPTPLKQMIRGGLRSGNAGAAVQASDTVRQLRNINPQILNDFNDEDLRLATMIGTLTDYGVPPDQAYLQSTEAMKVPEAERKNRERAYDLQRGIDNKAREASDKKWMEGKLNSVWTSDPTLDPVMQAEWETVTRQEYLRTGNLDASRQYALDTINRAWGRTEVGGDRRYMKYAPEKFYGVPTLSPSENAAWMNEQLAADVARGAFVDPANPITPDRVTLTVDPTRRARDGRPIYQVMVKGQDGVFYAVTGKNGRPLPWTPNWERSAARERQQQEYDNKITALRNRRLGALQPLGEGVVR